MKVVETEDHLKALPLLAIVRSASGRICSRNEVAQWTQMGTEAPVVWAEADFPAKVVWDYAQEIGVPTTEAMAQLGIALLTQQLQQQAEKEGVELGADPAAAAAAAAAAMVATNGQPPAPPVPPPAPEPIVPTEIIVPGEAPQP